MKKTMKRLMSLVLVLTLAAAVLVPATTAQAADLKYTKNLTVYLTADGWVEWTATNSNTSKKLTSFKSSDTSIFEVQYDEAEGKKPSNWLKLNKAGTAKLSFKYGGKTYTSTVTVKKYTNPVKTFKLTGVSSGKDVSSKSKKTNNPSLKLKKSSDNAKLTIKAKSGWKIKSVVFTNQTDWKTLVSKTYKSSKVTSSYTKKLGKLRKSKSYYAEVTFVNTSNKGTITVYYAIN